MKSYLTKDFKKGFLLSEENLIKLNDLISKRLKEKNYPEIINYKVYRTDSLVFETSECNRVLEEENSKRNKINNIEISHSSETLKFKLTFNNKENVRLEIESNEKDFTYLLFSDLKDYLTTEVLRFRGFNFSDLRLDRYVFPLIMLIVLFYTIITLAKDPIPNAELNELLKPDHIEQKLNFLVINTQDKIKPISIIYTMFVPVVLFILFFPTLTLFDKMYPRNIFYFGKTLNYYDQICSVRNKVFWGILIALLISVVAGLMVFKITV